MLKMPVFLLLTAGTLTFAQDSVGARNAFGWENGLSYRRFVNPTTWIGINLSGSYDKESTKGSSGYRTVLTASDSVISVLNDERDTTLDYSGALKIEAGKTLFGYKKFRFDMFLGVGYTYGVSNTYRLESNLYSVKRPSNSILGFAGFQPEIMLWDRLGIGMQFGLQYTHSWSDYKYSEQYNTASSEQTITTNTTMYGNTIRMFGNVSLTNNLIVLFYF